VKLVHDFRNVLKRWRHGNSCLPLRRAHKKNTRPGQVLSAKFNGHGTGVAKNTATLIARRRSGGFGRGDRRDVLVCAFDLHSRQISGVSLVII